MASNQQFAHSLSRSIPSGLPQGSSITNDEISAAIGMDAPDSLNKLLMRASRLQHNPQQTLYHQGSRSESVYFVTSGTLKLITHLPNGRSRIVRLHRPRSVIGLNSLLGQSNDHTSVTVTKVNALRLPVSSLQRLRADDPNAYVWLVECWYDYLKEADTWITQFSTGPIRGRVARLLEFLDDFEVEAEDEQFHLLTCEEMGSILGVTTESVSRIIAHFKREHILYQYSGGKNELYATDSARLREIAEE